MKTEKKTNSNLKKWHKMPDYSDLIQNRYVMMPRQDVRMAFNLPLAVETDLVTALIINQIYWPNRDKVDQALEIDLGPLRDALAFISRDDYDLAMSNLKDVACVEIDEYDDPKKLVIRLLPAFYDMMRIKNSTRFLDTDVYENQGPAAAVLYTGIHHLIRWKLENRPFEHPMITLNLQKFAGQQQGLFPEKDLELARHRLIRDKLIEKAGNKLTLPAAHLDQWRDWLRSKGKIPQNAVAAISPTLSRKMGF